MIPGDWHITAENLRNTKSSSSTANWLVRVPADSHATLTYTAAHNMVLVRRDPMHERY